MIQRLHKGGVDLSRCLLGVLPLGTGNDLSRTLRWGATVVLSQDLEIFKKIVRKFSYAPFIYIDLWDVKLTVDEKEGQILTIQDTQKKPMMEDEKIVKVMQRTFIGNMSIGQEARVGFGFDKHRTSNRMSNFMIYAWEGLKKVAFGKALKLNDIVESFWVPKEGHDYNDVHMGTYDREKHPTNVMFKTVNRPQTQNGRPSVTSQSSTTSGKYDNIVLKGKPISLFIQNITVIGSGITNTWTKSNKIALAVDHPEVVKFYTYSLGPYRK